MNINRNYWLFGNSPDSREWKDEWDINNINNKDFWPDFKSMDDLRSYYVKVNINKIQPGDIAIFWSARYFSITTVGIIVESPFKDKYSDEKFVNIALSQLPFGKEISGSSINRQNVWKNKKPFAVNPDGTFNGQFATPKPLDLGQLKSIYSKLPEKSERFLTENNINKIVSSFYRLGEFNKFRDVI